MYDNSISVVIPAYNEQDNLKKIVYHIHSYLINNFKDFEIILIDDGSTDNTEDVCKELSSIYKDKLIILRHDKNRGYGAALRTGLFSANKTLVFYTDADNQFNINELDNFIPYLAGYDLIIGYRKDRKDSILRKICARVYNRLVFFVFGLDVKDIDCSFKLFNKEALKLLTIDRNEFLVDTELLVKAKLNNLKIKELPVLHYPRVMGKSTVKIKHVFSTIKDMIFLYKNLHFSK